MSKFLFEPIGSDVLETRDQSTYGDTDPSGSTKNNNG